MRLADTITEIGTVVSDGPWVYRLAFNPAEYETPWVSLDDGQFYTLNGVNVSVNTPEEN